MVLRPHSRVPARVPARVLGTVAIVLASGATLPAQTPRIAPRTLAAIVDSVSSRAVVDGIAPALGVAITMDGKIVHARSYGMADTDASLQVNARLRLRSASG